jgi:hypothetical protein
VKAGKLFAVRLEYFHRLSRELAFEQDKAEIGLVRTEKKRWKGIAKLGKEIQKARREEGNIRSGSRRKLSLLRRKTCPERGGSFHFTCSPCEKRTIGCWKGNI